VLCSALTTRRRDMLQAVGHDAINTVAFSQYAVIR
jgi:hypothetical protein